MSPEAREERLRCFEMFQNEDNSYAGDLLEEEDNGIMEVRGLGPY
jgi:hypothetical protein